MYIPRILEDNFREVFSSVPAILVTGPRASGKTTTCLRYVNEIVRLDQPEEGNAFRSSPDAQLASTERPVLLDEWQNVPEVIGAVKRAVDQNFVPSQFLLTGSARSPRESLLPATGRVVQLHLGPLCQREISGQKTTSILKRVADGNMNPPADSPGFEEYVELAMRGGFPEVALSTDTLGAATVLRGYASSVIFADAKADSSRRDTIRLRKFISAVAENSCGVYEYKYLTDTAGITFLTAKTYESLFVDLGLLDVISAWSSNRVQRLVAMPKRLLSDSGLLAALWDADKKQLVRNDSMLGKLIENYVINQVIAELHALGRRDRAFHVRTEKGRQEIDLVVELFDGRIAAFEVKKEAGPDKRAGRHLEWLRDAVGTEFALGIVFHTGTRTYSLSDRVIATPISALWS